MPRKPADQSVSREDILQAAAAVLRRNGYDATTMKDIAAQVNLTAASLYHHFENKDVLLLAVLELGLQYVSREIETVLASDAPNAEKLRRMVRVHITNQTANRPAGVAMIYEVRPIVTQHLRNGLSDEAVAEYTVRREGFFAERRRFESLFQQVVQAGIDSGEFRQVDVPVIVKTMLGANNWVSVWYSENGRLSGEQIADQIAEMFVRALSK
ncbi:MAG: TetR family transcriptional regulator [Chloroflexi bacterium]|nr:TetR family transcriptional regulator [Chloroflexota bacterium]